jgi:SAM-dependent methyltransferase
MKTLNLIESSTDASVAAHELSLPSKLTSADLFRISGNNPYIGYNAPRYLVLLKLLDKYVHPATNILDVGRTFLTELISAKFSRPITTIGFGTDHETPNGPHYEFDLNASQHESQWRSDIPRHDIVLVAEVIEHLYTSPNRVLAFFRSLVKPGGKLIITTPNAVAFGRRISLLLGRNPFELIREDPTNPGHFREYTAKELTAYAKAQQFEVESVQSYHYFDFRYAPYLQANKKNATGPRNSRPLIMAIHASGLSNTIYRIIPPKLKTGLTLVLTRPL